MGKYVANIMVRISMAKGSFMKRNEFIRNCIIYGLFLFLLLLGYCFNVKEFLKFAATVAMMLVPIGGCLDLIWGLPMYLRGASLENIPKNWVYRLLFFILQIVIGVFGLFLFNKDYFNFFKMTPV